jgi:DNA-binding response OmpR family regulator
VLYPHRLKGKVPMRPSPQSRATSILLAESNPQIRTAVRSILLHYEFSNITEASDSKAFIDTARTASYGAILLDSGIPNLDAVAVTRFIRSGKLGINRTAIIILLAHRSDMTFVYEAREAGVTEFVAKPFSSSVLMTRLVNALKKPRAFITSEAYTGPCRRTGREEPDIEPPKQRLEDQVPTPPEELVILPRQAS